MAEAVEEEIMLSPTKKRCLAGRLQTNAFSQVQRRWESGGLPSLFVHFGVGMNAVERPNCKLSLRHGGADFNCFAIWDNALVRIH